MDPRRAERHWGGLTAIAVAIAGCAKAPIAAAPPVASIASSAVAPPRAPPTACDWQRIETCKQACNEGRGEICAAVAYAVMVGPPSDPASAASFAKRACNAGDLAGCVFLGELELAGKGIAPNEPIALSLFQRACDGGDPSGCRFYGNLMERGSPPAAPNPRAALTAYDHACAHGDALACSSLDRVQPSSAPATMPIVACPDSIEGVWIGQTRREQQSDWYIFELTFRRDDPKSASLTGSIQVHYWRGTEHDALTPTCRASGFEAITTMTAKGDLTGDRIHFEGASPHVAVTCGSDSKYTPDRFEGTLAAASAALTWLDDRHPDFKQPMIFRRTRCAALK